MAFLMKPSLAAFSVAFSLICLGACATQQDAMRPKAPLNHTICDSNGIELIPAFASTELIIFGEQHGTNEIPLFVAEIVCALSAAKEVNLLLELNADQQRELTRFLDSRGSDADKRRFIDAVFRTKDQQHDGRTSVAMFELIDQARQLRRKGRKISVIFFAPDPNEQNFDQSEYEADMARNIRAAVRTDSNVKNIALVGNFHSRRISDVGGLKVVPAASLLSDLKVFSLVSSALAGEAWQCRQDGCGVQQLNGTTEPPKRGVRAFPTNMSGYDGVFSVGTPYTYSKPAE
jgi:hypothetical protein